MTNYIQYYKSAIDGFDKINTVILSSLILYTYFTFLIPITHPTLISDYETDRLRTESLNEVWSNQSLKTAVGHLPVEAADSSERTD